MTTDCPGCQALTAELDHVKAMAQLDIDNANTELVIQRRITSRLKADLTRLRNEETPPTDVQQLLEHWKTSAGKNARTDIGPGGKRWALAQRAIKRWGLDRCMDVITAGCAFPYLHFGDRVEAQPAHDAKPWIDVEHLLGDEVRFERCEKVVLEAKLPPDERAELARIRAVVDSPAPARPRLVPQRKEEPRRGDVHDLLDGLTAHGFGWRPSGPDRWSAQCPCHEDRSPSLSITVKADSVVLAHCFGCGARLPDVAQALGLPLIGARAA